VIAAFSVSRPSTLPAPRLPPTFDTASTLRTANELVESYPDRQPGSAGSAGAARWFVEQLGLYGYRPEQIQTDGFLATIPGHGQVRLRNIFAVVPGGPNTQAIVVMAHRDDTGGGAGANDNASGTAALLELARTYAAPPGAGRAVRPQHTLIFVSTDGGAYGALGAARFASRSPYRNRIIGVLDLDAIAGRSPRLELGGDAPRSPSMRLVATAAAWIVSETGDLPGRPSALGQLIDLGLPFSLYEQAPFVARGVPAVTLTTMGDRPAASTSDRSGSLDARRLGEMGRAAHAILSSLDEGPAPTGTAAYVYLGERVVRGWAIEFVLVSMLLPFAIAAVDLFARCRRRRIAIAPALRSYRSRLGFWLWAAAVFELFALAGVWPGGAERPLNPELGAGVTWPRLGVVGFVVVLALGWVLARHRLVRRRQVTREEELAGYTGTLLVLGLVSLVVAATNPFALLFVLPSLHAWLWLPQVRDRRPAIRAVLLAAGFLGPLLALGSFAIRYGLGLDAPWYLAELTAIGYVPFMALVAFVAWLAGAAQMTALATGRYAPYPSAAERPPRGPLRNVVRAIVLGRRARRRRVAVPQPIAVEE